MGSKKKKQITDEKDDDVALEFLLPPESSTKILALLMIIIILLVIFLLGFDLGTRLINYYPQKVCSEKPPNQTEGVLIWNKQPKPEHGSFAFYLCGNHKNAKIHKLLRCNYDTNLWEQIFVDGCDCTDELPPVIGEMTRNPPTNYSRKIGSVVNYLCTQTSTPMAEYTCGNNSMWQLKTFKQCECEEEPPLPKNDSHFKIWPGESRAYGSLITYLCTENQNSVPSLVIRCVEDGKWKVVFENDCVCRGVPAFDLPDNYLTTLQKTNIGNCVELRCDRNNKLSALKYRICCNVSALWEVYEEWPCVEKIYMFTTPLNFEDARADCVSRGGHLAHVKNRTDMEQITEFAKYSEHSCFSFYIGTRENTSVQWVSSLGNFVDITDKLEVKLGNDDLPCLVLQIHEGKEHRRRIVNEDCNKILCFLCFLAVEHDNEEESFVPFEVKVTYYIAQKFCAGRGGHLFPITNIPVLMNYPIPMSAQRKCFDGYYIGGRNWVRSWYYEPGVQLTFTDFAENEPNSFSENCIALSSLSSFKWIDVDCSHPLCYFCQSTVEMTEDTVEKRNQNYVDFCPDSWLRFDVSCYLIQLQLVNAAEAEKSCSDQNSTLLFLLSVKEQIHLTNVISVVYGNLVKYPFHTGMRRTVIDDVFIGDFWLSTHPMNFDLFERYHSSSNNSSNGTQISCGILKLNVEQWLVVDCETKGYSICRKDFACSNPPESNRFSRRDWSGDRFPGAVVNYMCSTSPYDRRVWKSFKCHKTAMWIESTIKYCESTFDAYPLRLPWVKAEETCEKLGGNLAIAPSRDSQRLITEAINRLSKEDNYCRSQFYIGLKEDLTRHWRSPSCADPSSEIEVTVLANPNLWVNNLRRFRDDYCVVISKARDYLLMSEYCDTDACFVCEDNMRHYHPQTALRKYTEALLNCSAMNMHLATVRSEEQFNKLRSLLQSNKEIEDCFVFYLAIQSSFHSLQWINGSTVPSGVVYSNPSLRNFISPCVVYVTGPQPALKSRDCQKLNCFVCQLPPQLSQQLLPIVLGDRSRCPDKFIYSNRGCILFRVAEVESLDAHVFCLKRGSSSVVLEDTIDLRFLEHHIRRISSADHFMSNFWHTGLYSGNSTVMWRGGQIKRFFPAIYASNVEDTCSMLHYGHQSNEFLWLHSQSCKRKGNIICTHDPGFLGFLNLIPGRLSNPAVMKSNTVDLSSCAATCEQFEYSIMTVMKFYSNSSKLYCVCAKGIDDDQILLFPSYKRRWNYNCESPQPCPNLNSQICGCDEKNAVYLLNKDVCLGCYSLDLTTWALYSYERPIPYETFFQNSPPFISVKDLQFRCRILCRSMKYIYSGRKLSANPNDLCFCFFHLPHFPTPASDCMSRKSSERNWKHEETNLIIFRLANPHRF